MGLFSTIKSWFSSDKASKSDEAETLKQPLSSDLENNDDAFAMNSDSGHVVSISELPVKSDSSVLDSRWPPFPRAVQVLSPKHLIDAQAELVRQLCSAIPLSDEEVERYLMPVVWNLACFVHLLPASAHHHHRGLGGLFGHSLETAIFAAQTAKNKIFDFKARPEDAYMNKARWILACALSGLTHDVGKAVLDIRVYSDKGDWRPTTGSITEWCRAKGISSYYVAMNEDREHKKHEQASLAYARVIIPRRTYLYLSQTGNSKIEEELHAAINGQREGCLVGEILGEADSLSVKLDERRQGTIDPRDKLVTTPLADAIVKAMRSLIKEGTWKINTADATIWLTTQGCFIDWSDVSGVTKVLSANGVKSVPHDNGAMAGMLLTEGLIEAAPGTVSPDERFWPVCPLVLKDRTITCIKFRVPIRLIGSAVAYAAMPVYVPNLPMLETDAKAWLDAHGFDPSSEENKIVEEEDYINQLVDCVTATPDAYQTPNVGFYTKDADKSPSIAAMLPPDDPDLEVFAEAEVDDDMPPSYIEEIENQVLQSDFCREDDELSDLEDGGADIQNENAEFASEEIPQACEVDEISQAPGNSETTPIEANPDNAQDSSECEAAEDEGAVGEEVRKYPPRAVAAIVDAAPVLKICEASPSEDTGCQTTEEKPVYATAAEAEAAKAPPEYKTLDVSDDAFTLLLPGGTRKKRRRNKGRTDQDSPASEKAETNAASRENAAADAAGANVIAGEQQVGTAVEQNAAEIGPVTQQEAGSSSDSYPSAHLEENRGNAHIDSNPQTSHIEESSEDAAPGSVPVNSERKLKEPAEDQAGAIEVVRGREQHTEPSSPAKGSRIEVDQAQVSSPMQERKQSQTVPVSASSTVGRIAQKCGSNHRQAAKELISEMKQQMLNRRGDLLSSQVWKNVVGFVTDDKAFVDAMDALHISVPVVAMQLSVHQRSPKLQWDREERKVHLKIEKPKDQACN